MTRPRSERLRLKTIIPEGDRAMLDRAFQIALAHLPTRFLWAARTVGCGPWNSFIQPDPADLITFAYPDGHREADRPASIARFSSYAKALETPAKGDFHGALIWTLFSFPDFTFDEFTAKNYMIMLRRHAAIALFSSGGAPGGYLGGYLPSTIATGHDRIEDPAALEAEFPGCFTIEA